VRQAIHGANLALAFALELCALAALCYWGFSVGGVAVTKVLLGIGAPVCAAVLWGLFAAPRAPVSVPLLKLVTRFLVFGSAALALYATGHHVLAFVFAIVVVANTIMVRLGR
jgi:alpha-beta hydrolase superfamily lysophospholipase